MRNAFTMKNVLLPETEGPVLIRSRTRRFNPVSCRRIAVRRGLTGKPRAKNAVNPPAKGTP